MSRQECLHLGWDELDIIIVTGDAYIDHPSFGAAIIGRFLLSKGFKVGIIAQPDWRSNDDFLALGTPRLFFGVSSGNMDSMINHYTAQKKIRSNDAFSPDGKAGLRPDRAVITYTNKLKQLFKNSPVVLGGIEASLRRIPHYDYWSDKVRNSILFDSKADLIAYGMAERSILTIAQKLKEGSTIDSLKDIPGTVVSVKDYDNSGMLLPPAEKTKDKEVFFEMSTTFHQCFNRKTIYQPFGNRYLRHNPPSAPLQEDEIDAIYGIYFSRKPHPIYKQKKIPAFEQIRASITSHRGCFGGCNFCSLYYHQGKTIQSRSKESIVSEIDELATMDYYRGMISDIGGPSANMYGIVCLHKDCTRNSCLQPSLCPHLDLSHKKYLELLNFCRNKPNVKQIFVSSGIRSDMAIYNSEFIDALVAQYTGGRLKLAPEHKSKKVLSLMNKPDFSTYELFVEKFKNACDKYGKKFYTTPYIIVGHPGTTLEDTIDLALYLKQHNMRLEQIQEFTPTPLTISTTMYYTGKDFNSGNTLYVPKGRDIRLQKALVQWFIPENRKYVIEALRKANRVDLIPVFTNQKTSYNK